MIKVKANQVKAVINSTFPDYRRREVYVNPTNTVTFHDLNWSGGTRAEYRACSIEGRQINIKHDMGKPVPWANPFEGLKIDLPVDHIIVKGGVFCGKTSMLYIYVHPDNMPRLLTA